jgi:thiazole/oxazole-forming peptide maturase SagD family component
MAYIDNFLNGREVFKKYIIDTINKRYIETNYYNTEYFASLCTKRLGVKYLESSVTFDPSLPQFFRATAYVKIENKHFFFGGSSFHSDEAKSKCVGEFIERLSSYQEWDRKKYSKGLCRSLISPIDYAFFERDEIYWKGNGKIIDKVQITTNGCAGWFTKDGAIVEGLLELIERDGFFVYWLNTLSPKKIDVDSYVMDLKKKSVQDLLQKEKDLILLFDKFKKHSIQYHFLDITTDLKIPSVCVVTSMHYNGEVNYAVGAASGFNATSCFLSASFEALGVLNSFFSQEVYVLPDTYEPFVDKSIDINKRMQIYRCTKNNKYFEFFIANMVKVSVVEWLQDLDKYTTEKDQLKYLKKIFKEKAKKSKNFIPYTYVFKNKLLKELNYFVVRVMCKGLYSIYLNEHAGDTSHPRLKQFVTDMGYTNVAKLNIWPHPFP